MVRTEVDHLQLSLPNRHQLVKLTKDHLSMSFQER
jgi:hypothetical protein